MSFRSTIAITAGDPAGVGPEVILKTLQQRCVPTGVRLIVIGDAAVFEFYARRLRLPLPRWQRIGETSSIGARSAGPLALLDTGYPVRPTPGRSSAAAGQAAYRYLVRAVGAWREGRVDAVVTAPVTKWAIAKVHRSFAGHTEFFASHAQAKEVLMMFASQRLRVVLLTRHLPLREVPQAITPSLVRNAIRLTWRALRTSFGIRSPRLVLCGLNPHAGEAGRCGDEERRVMAPALRALRRAGIACDGPVAADGFFGSRVAYDAVICPYHDQGLVPFKVLARDTGCQVTLGLPFVRTSPDHGSALDIAGRGVADAGSMRYALGLAAKLVRRTAP